jgi:site-specific recombinase XerC
VQVQRSKTDQLGASADVAIPFGSHADVCPVRALEAWRAASGDEEGALFRSVDHHGRVGGRLDGRDVARTLKALAARAGIASALVSGHSLRAGRATTHEMRNWWAPPPPWRGAAIAPSCSRAGGSRAR